MKFASRESNLDVWPGARPTACPLCYPWGASVRLPGVDRQQLVFPVADAGLSLQLGYCTTARKAQGDEFPFTSSIWARPLAGRSRQSRSKKKSVAARRSDTTNASAYSTDSKKKTSPRSDLARPFLCRAIALANFRLPKKPNSEKSEPFKPARRLRANPKPVKRCKFGWLGRAPQYKTARLPFHSMGGGAAVAL